MERSRWAAGNNYQGKTIFAGTQRSRLTEFFTTSGSQWTNSRGQSQQVSLSLSCQGKTHFHKLGSEDEQWRGSGPELKTTPRGIEIDLMTKSVLVIDIVNNSDGLCPQHSILLLSLWIVIKKDEMSFDSILWDLYQFKRCTLQGSGYSVYSCPCPGRQRFKSWTSLSLFQFTYFQPCVPSGPACRHELIWILDWWSHR